MNISSRVHIDSYQDSFHSSEFKHVVVDNFLSYDEAKGLETEIQNLDDNILRNYTHFNAKVRSSIGREGLGQKVLQTIDYFQSEEFLEQLRNLTGDKHIIADPELAQGGALSYLNGHFVNLHTDNVTHPQRLNHLTSLTLLLYLSEDWKDEYKGNLELRNKDNSENVATISPLFNRLVIMEANKDSIHGLPEKLTCPKGVTRKALVLWYYTPTKRIKFSPTKYYYKPTDKLKKKIDVVFGNFSLKVYYVLKKSFGDWDPIITSFMDKVFKR
jgi:Rps23 Pro-64 3,4-dihydroxylase Tpa1-like proline 4-hydroxylase